MTSGTRSAALPNIPTLAEPVERIRHSISGSSCFAPAGTPKEIITRLNGEATKVLMQPAVRERLEAAGFEPKTGSPRKWKR